MEFRILYRDEFMQMLSNILSMQQEAVEKAGLDWSEIHNHFPTREEMWKQLKDISIIEDKV